MARPQKAKPKKFEKLSDRLAKAAKSPVKKIAKASAVIKKKVAKKTKAALGIGYKKRTREATAGDIRRKGISNLKASNASLARFIALRYGAKAIAKYQDYAGRLRRSIRLRKQVVKIDDATFRIKGYIIRTDTAGNNPYSCTCPDFSQFSNDDRNWLSSKAGPFNPCKHMMAVRDRDKGGKWVCSSGVCTLNPLAVSGYATKALCEAAVIPPPFIGGQCFAQYTIDGGYTLQSKNRFEPDQPWQNFSGGGYGYNTLYGPLNLEVINNEGAEGTTTKLVFTAYTSGGVLVTDNVTAVLNGFAVVYRILFNVNIGRPSRNDGLPDNCGNLPSKCP